MANSWNFQVLYKSQTYEDFGVTIIKFRNCFIADNKSTMMIIMRGATCC